MRRYVIDIDFSAENIVRYIETFEQDFYPVFFINQNKHSYHLGYGDKNKEYSEFLDIVIDEEQKLVTVERDLKSTLILFYYYKDGRLIISSDYNYFAQTLDLKNMIDEDYLKLFLWNWRDTIWSICKWITLLYPRKKYSFQKDSYKVEETQFEGKSIQMEEILSQNFCNLNEHNIVWAGISGGKDSAYLPILSKKSNNFPFTFISWQLHGGEVWKQQRDTISKVVNFLDIPYEYYTITEEDYPLRNDPVGIIKHPIEEIYKNCLLGEIAILKKHWINTVFNGFGWDEAFEPKDGSRDFQEEDKPFLSFIFQEDFIDDVDNLNASDRVYKDSLFPTSLYESLISRNNLYIQHGIWPITPYFNIDVYTYFQSLQVSKNDFFTVFYDNFDPKLKGAFNKNTNMAEYFQGYFKSEYFNTLLQASVDAGTSIMSYYNIENIKKYFWHTPSCSDELVNSYDFFLYKFVYVSLMLK